MTIKGETKPKHFGGIFEKMISKDQQSDVLWDLTIENGSNVNSLVGSEVNAVRLIEFISDKIYYCHAKTEEIGTKSVTVKPRKDCLQINFCLAGSLTYENSSREVIYQANENEANLLYYNCEEVSIQSSLPFEGLIFNIHLGHIEHTFPDLFQKIQGLIANTKKASVGVFSKRPVPLSPSLRAMLQDFVSRKYQGCFMKHYVELKTLEFLIALIDDSENMDQAPAMKLSPEDLQKMEEAKSILLDRMSNPPSIKELAQLVGTNEFDLKRKFKQAFGNTVFGYLQAHRMQVAKQLLEQSDKLISEIAEHLGYVHATHFTSAFKKAFGILPKELRK
ncbi:helix-turn-helix transcriptional regulator [Belliella kenyensis]|uniref:Helix-turn-helix transcriptional regulator n=2 Tax=Belliella kenyensis TaxID=1472724 RepID=A0ABV8EM11_9BACT|nr:AraC family transcriptional regulator [Belliella kenyensis]MCH7401280.1 AraC family transcriptional regulator [Belliella kenyensis]MDN3602725.1 AraC family transcriptional regulator [Belliella kenyensis]